MRAHEGARGILSGAGGSATKRRGRSVMRGQHTPCGGSCGRGAGTWRIAGGEGGFLGGCGWMWGRGWARSRGGRGGRRRGAGMWGGSAGRVGAVGGGPARRRRWQVGWAAGRWWGSFGLWEWWRADGSLAWWTDAVPGARRWLPGGGRLAPGPNSEVPQPANPGTARRGHGLLVEAGTARYAVRALRSA
jgi:hypothetical protein